ncbi:MAG TPA: TspO/MBR family protein [Ruminococcus sp.]
MKKFSLTDMLIFVVATELVGAVSALISGNFRGFYEELKLPPLSPPGFVFPIVWAILYAAMGVSAYLIYRDEKHSAQRSTALGLYVIQLAINFAWSIVFFRFKLFIAAVIITVLLIIAVAAMIKSFHKVNSCAAIINIPYLLWTAFALYLTIGVTVLN